MYPRMALQLNTSLRSYGFYKKNRPVLGQFARRGCGDSAIQSCPLFRPSGRRTAGVVEIPLVPTVWLSEVELAVHA